MKREEKRREEVYIERNYVLRIEKLSDESEGKINVNKEGSKCGVELFN